MANAKKRATKKPAKVGKKAAKAAPKQKAKKPAAKAKPAPAKAKAKAKATPAKAKSATKVAADAYATAVAAAIGSPPPVGKLGTLRLENHRKPFAGTLDKLSEAEKTQLAAVVGEDTMPSLFGLGDEAGDDQEMAWLEYMDVVDTTTGATVANLLIWPFGDGAVVHHGTTTMIASIVQHGINPHESTGKAWLSDFARAWAEGAPRLGADVGHFRFDAEQIAADDDDD